MTGFRSRLVWFAWGAGATAAATVLAMVLVPEKQEASPYLMVQTQAAPKPGGPGQAKDELAVDETAAAKLFYECGARRIHSIAAFPGGGGYALLPLTRAESAASECVIRRAVAQGYSVKVIVTTNIYENHQP